MCYSAQVEAEYKKFTREFGAILSLKEFFDIYWRRRSDKSVKIPKAIDLGGIAHQRLTKGSLLKVHHRDGRAHVCALRQRNDSL